MSQYLSPILPVEELQSELRARTKTYIEKTVKSQNPSTLEEKVALEERDGWKRLRKSKHSYRLSKDKPIDERLEDEVWCLCAKMGFPELSKGRNFTAHVSEGLNPRQIDVFAKDDDVALFIECTTSETPKKKNMSNLIEKIISIQKEVYTSTQKQFAEGKKLKKRFVIATRNIDWGKADLLKAEEANIVVLREQDLDYYSHITRHLRIAAKYQFLASIFKHEDIPGLSISVPASKGKMGSAVFYNFLISPKELLKIAYVSHKGSKDASSLGTYQRMLTSKRLKEISEYVDEGGRFPTNIVINIDTQNKKSLRFDKKEQIGDSAVGTLHLPSCYASAWVIDGQHRLYGYATSQRANGELPDNSVLPVLAYENLPPSEQANMFVDINHKQVKVSKNLLIDLFSDLHWDSDNQELAIVSLCSKTVKSLDENLTSPIKGRIIQTGKKATNQRCLSLTSLADGLKAHKFYGDASGKFLKHGPFTGENNQDSLDRGIEILIGFLDFFAKHLPEQWALGNDKGGYIATNNAINSIYRVLREICIYLDKKNSITCDEKAPATLLQEIKPLIMPVIDYFKTASPEDITNYRRQLGLAGQRKCAMDMMGRIHEKHQGFCPEGLTEYLNSNDVEGTRQARQMVTDIQRKVFDYVVKTLQKEFSDKPDDWWVKGIPQKIRSECVTRRELDPDRLEKEQYLMLLDYKSIANQNWNLFKDFFSLEAKGNKDAQLKWLQDLNSIRNIVSHPERGMLSKDQVVLVKLIHDKIAAKPV